MKIIYFDCFAGVAGDMILGALMDAGLGLNDLKDGLAGLDLGDYDITTEDVIKNGIGGTKAHVVAGESHGHHHRGFVEIKNMIESSELGPKVKERAMAAFTRLGSAEAHIHRKSLDEIHFHEVGALDSIIDVVGVCIGLDLMGIEAVYASALNLGGGTVECAHGTIPVPAPAVTEILKGVPVYSTGIDRELVTPTGAALISTLAAGFGPIPEMTISQVGYGAGTAEIAIPNLVRVMIGQAEPEALEAVEKSHHHPHGHGHPHGHHHGHDHHEHDHSH